MGHVSSFRRCSLLHLLLMLMVVVKPFPYRNLQTITKSFKTLSSTTSLRAKRVLKPAQNTTESQFRFDLEGDLPFFPQTIDELAQDVCFSLKYALMNRLSRLRVDFDTKLLAKERFSLKWLLVFAQTMLDKHFYNKIHVFVDKKYDLSQCIDIWNDLVNDSNLSSEDKIVELDRIRLSYIDFDTVMDDDSLYIIFHPNNVCNTIVYNTVGDEVVPEVEVNVLEEVEAISFNGAYHNRPVVLVNPVLIATAWNDFGAKEPMLLSDFSQVYYISDDYHILPTREKWFGVTQSAYSGFQLFAIESITNSSGSSQSYVSNATSLNGTIDGGNLIDAPPCECEYLGSQSNSHLKSLSSECSIRNSSAHLSKGEERISMVVEGGGRGSSSIDGFNGGSEGYFEKFTLLRTWPEGIHADDVKSVLINYLLQDRHYVASHQKMLGMRLDPPRIVKAPLHDEPCVEVPALTSNKKKGNSWRSIKPYQPQSQPSPSLQTTVTSAKKVRIRKRSL